LPKLELKEFSAREIQTFAEDIEKTNIKNQQRIDTARHEFSTQIKIAVMTRLGIPLVRIAQRLNIHRETISKYTQKNEAFFEKIHQEFKSGTSIPDMAQKHGAPLLLVWSVILEEKTDQERLKLFSKHFQSHERTVKTHNPYGISQCRLQGFPGDFGNR